MTENQKNHRKIGTEYEQRAAAYLENKGFRIAVKNYRLRFGEIDLIGWDGDSLVFVEVKYRSGSRYGMPEVAVDRSKQRTIRRVAEMYMAFEHIPADTCCRFDVVAILGEEIRHYVNAFGGL